MFNYRKTLSAVAIVLSFATPATSDGLAGAYLSASNASLRGDYEAASYYFSKALEQDPENGFLRQNAMISFLATGDFVKSNLIAQTLTKNDADSHLAELIILADLIAEEKYDIALKSLPKSGDQFSKLVAQLLSGWINLGLGKSSEAINAFDQLTEPTHELFGQYHKALALASVGDYESADKLLQGDERGSLRLNKGSVIAHAEILAELERTAEALALLAMGVQGDQDTQLMQLQNAINEGNSQYSHITNARHGAAEVFYTLASVLSDPENAQTGLLYARLAQKLRPENSIMTILTADILKNSEQHQLAIEAYASVSEEDPNFLDAEFGRSEALVDSGKVDAAIEVLRGLTRSRTDNPRVFMTLGDNQRLNESYFEARESYDKAVAMIEEAQPNHWYLFYAIGICNERLDNWPRAEEGFRKALELAPGHPSVLNYLGYSMVEKNINLEEAQEMIEQAVTAQPNQGAITDSLGWVRYRLGKFNDAVQPLERAVELLPVDPIVNDHLGDAYWMVGRKREAEFQWRRAMSFDPEEVDADRIRLKLEIGLDAVLLEEEQLDTQTGDAN